jgi:hypothetical protein
MIGLLILVVVVAYMAYSDGEDAPAPSTAQAAPAAAAPSTQNAAPAQGTADVTIASVGDVVMGTPEFGLPPANGSTLFSSVTSLLKGNVVFGNLEEALATGPGSKCGGASGGGCYAFASPPSYARNLKAAGFTVMGIANNHALDWGPSGQRSTVAALDSQRILHTGRPGEIAVQKLPGGGSVAVISVAPYSWSQNALNIPGTVALVRKATTMAPIVMVNMHVGAEGSSATHVPQGSETFLGEDRGNSRALARAVVDAGADLVVGQGPHVLRGMEFRGGRLIAYSLGNFLGYKTFSVGGVSGQSGALSVTLAPDGAFKSARFSPTQLSGDGVPSPGGSGISIIQSLSRQDFGSTAARISSGGDITPPR